MCGLDCGFALGSVKSLGGSCGCVNMVALMPCKFFVSFCGILVVVRHWAAAAVVCVLILLVFCVGLVSDWPGCKVGF